MRGLTRLRRATDTLFFRLVLLVVLTVISSQTFTLWLAARERTHLVSQQLYTEVVNTLADLEGMLDVLPRAERPRFLESYNRPGLPQLLPNDAANGIEFSDRMPSLGTALRERLSVGLGEPVPVRWRRLGDRNELWVSVHVVGEQYWLVLPLGRFTGGTTHAIWLAATLASLLAMVVAFLIAWRVTRPLIRLAGAAHQLGEGQTPAPVPPTGPHEIVSFTRRFNSMVVALDAAARERRLMLAGLSHDLRTPLTRLKLSVELQPDNTDREGMLDDIDELSRIVRQFIDFARSEEVLHREPVALAELADSVVARFRREDLDVHLERHTDAELQLDPLAMERLLSNLIENARRYGATPIVVTVDADDAGVRLTVTDQGAGIAAAQREAALAPFERLAEHRGTDGGSGLGLAIVSRIVKQHEGVLRFLDPDDGGFAVQVTLPRQ
ncbi:ATP-binding protein [Crenobacter sp. SG2303]|uniref:histidine kinase n=1 Tax=Crenobacter oryzisoli TaxID=3056844 RepID=A0ABT7XKY1_9NEIS|nr:ATP-binding protein [Crenobacter sp. SG2303]MDN0074440.1 ATP-binding protein [Crenobacter sp. SG2303]